MDSIRQVELWRVQGWDGSHVTGLGWSCGNWWHHRQPGCPTPLCPAAGLSRGTGVRLVAPPCPADPTSTPGTLPQTRGCGWQQGWAPGLLRHWVRLAQGASEAVGAQGVPPTGEASCSVRSVRVTAAASTSTWGPSCTGGTWAGRSPQPGTPLPPRGQAKGSDAQGGLCIGDQPVRAGGLPLRHLSPLGPSRGMLQLQAPQHGPSLPGAHPGTVPSWQGPRSRQQEAGLCWHSHGLPAARARQEENPVPGSCRGRIQQPRVTPAMHEPAWGRQLPGTVLSLPSHRSGSPLGQLTVPGELCLVPTTKPLSGKAPELPAAQGGGRGGESCRAQERESQEQQVRAGSWQTQVRKVSAKLLALVGSREELTEANGEKMNSKQQPGLGTGERQGNCGFGVLCPPPEGDPLPLLPSLPVRTASSAPCVLKQQTRVRCGGTSS